MATLHIKIQSLEDAANGMQALEGVDSPEQTVSYPHVTAVIQEGGMQSGATSILIAMKRDGEQKTHFTEISALTLEALYASFRGAQERWGQDPQGLPIGRFKS